MFETLLSNQFLSGGLVIGAIAYLKDQPKKVWNIVQGQFKTSVTFEDWCSELEGLKLWINQNLDTKRTRQVIGNKLVLAHGNYFGGFYKKVPFWINFQRVESKGGGNNYRDIYSIIFLTRNITILKDFLKELNVLGAPPRKQIFVWNTERDGSHGRGISRTPRSLESVLLPDSLVTSLLKDIDWFLNNKEWYVRTGESHL